MSKFEKFNISPFKHLSRQNIIHPKTCEFQVTKGLTKKIKVSVPPHLCFNIWLLFRKNRLKYAKLPTIAIAKVDNKLPLKSIINKRAYYEA